MDAAILIRPNSTSAQVFWRVNDADYVSLFYRRTTRDESIDFIPVDVPQDGGNSTVLTGLG